MRRERFIPEAVLAAASHRADWSAAFAAEAAARSLAPEILAAVRRAAKVTARVTPLLQQHIKTLESFGPPPALRFVPPRLLPPPEMRPRFPAPTLPGVSGAIVREIERGSR